MAELDFQDKSTEVEVESYPLSSTLTVLSSAMDLYHRGLNVFPVLRPEEIRKLAQLYPHAFSAGDKRPYVLQPLFTSRMHLCDEFCLQKERKTNRKCPGIKPGLDFRDQYSGSNLGVMTGRTSENLVCVDCDSMIAFQDVYRKFINRKLDFWAYQTSRGGNLLFQVEKFELRNQPKKPGSAVEVWGSNHFCVLPPSVHDSGVIYTWLRDQNPFTGDWENGRVPKLSVNDLDWLGIGEHQYLVGKTILDNLPKWTAMLSIRNQKILAGKLTQGTRNSQLVKPAYEIAALIEKGLVSEEDGLDVLIQAASRANPPYPENQTRQMLKSAMNKKVLTTTREYYGANKTDTIWDQAYRFTNSYDWSSHGRTALTDQAVFKACCERCRMDRGQPFRASLREISELANISSLKTTTRALRRLEANLLIEYSGKSAGGTHCYIFGKAVDFGNDHIITTCNTSVVPTKHLKADDLGRREILDDIFGKIGRVSRICWEHLINHPEKSKSTIAKNTGLKYQSVYYIIPRLLALGIISWSRAEGLFIGENLSNDELTEIARKLGVYGKAKERRRNHEIERELRVNRAICQKQCDIINQIRLPIIEHEEMNPTKTLNNIDPNPEVVN